MTKIIESTEVPLEDIVKPKIVEQKFIEPVKYYRVNQVKFPKQGIKGLKPKKNKDIYE